MTGELLHDINQIPLIWIQLTKSSEFSKATGSGETMIREKKNRRSPAREHGGGTQKHNPNPTGARRKRQPRSIGDLLRPTKAKLAKLGEDFTCAVCRRRYLTSQLSCVTVDGCACLNCVRKRGAE